MCRTRDSEAPELVADSASSKYKPEHGSHLSPRLLPQSSDLGLAQLLLAHCSADLSSSALSQPPALVVLPSLAASAVDIRVGVSGHSAQGLLDLL